MNFTEITTCEALMQTCKLCVRLFKEHGFHWLTSRIAIYLIGSTPARHELLCATFNAKTKGLYVVSDYGLFVVNDDGRMYPISRLEINAYIESYIGEILSVTKDNKKDVVYVTGVPVTYQKVQRCFVGAISSYQTLLDEDTAIKRPCGMVMDESTETLYVSDYASHVIWSIQANTRRTQCAFGTLGRQGYSDLGSGKFNKPSCLSLHPTKKRLYVVDKKNRAIRECSFEGGRGVAVVKTIYKWKSGSGGIPKNLCVDWKHDLLFFIDTQCGLYALPICETNELMSLPRMIFRLRHCEEHEGGYPSKEMIPLLVFDPDKYEVIVFDIRNKWIWRWSHERIKIAI